MGKPISTNVTCDTCGQAWNLHVVAPDSKGNEKVDDKECIRVLKAELAKRPAPRDTYKQVIPGMGWNVEDIIGKAARGLFKDS